MHKIEINSRATLHLESAEARVAVSRSDEALVCLREYEACHDSEALHGSWHVHAARLAHASGDTELAARLFAWAQVPSLSNLENRSEEVEEAIRYLIRYCAIAARLGEALPQPDLPTEFLFRGIMNHAIRLGGSRERGKDMASDYTPEQQFAERRGITFRQRIVEIARQLPERAKSIFANFRPQAQKLEPMPTERAESIHCTKLLLAACASHFG